MVPALLILAATGSDWSPPQGNVPGGKLFARGSSLFLVARENAAGHADLFLHRSDDAGKTWKKQGLVASDPDPSTDIGDGNVTMDRSGTLYAAHRQNHGRRSPKTYSIHVAKSVDGGLTWQPLPIVEELSISDPGPSRGLWAPFVFVTNRGHLQCYFDDEHTPFVEGFPGHQWLEMRTYDEKANAWSAHVTVSRAHDPKDLSRDGMASVVQLKGSHLICALESVSTQKPIVGTTRYVTSDDEGLTWSWQKEERRILYAPKDPRHHAFCPWLLQPRPGPLACVFGTEEDSLAPAIAGSPAPDLHLDIKIVWSQDQGKTWSLPETVYKGANRNYLPSIAATRTTLAAEFLDFDKGWLLSTSNVKR